MLYTKIKASYIEAKDRLNRTFLVRPDIDLETLGCVICTGFRATYEHAFLFRARKISYVPESWLDDFFDDYRSMKGVTLEDLGPSFRFTYDTGDNWEFECKVYKRQVNYDSEEPAVIIDGAGAGIWEDNVGNYWAYLDGEIPPETSEDLEDMEWYMPWNLGLEQVGDTDRFDPEEEQERFSFELPADLKRYRRYSSDDDDDLYDDMPPDNIWYTFHKNLNNGVIMPYEVSQQLEEFKRVCGILKENGALPEQYEDLVQTGADPEDLRVMMTHIPALIYNTYEEEQAAAELKTLRDMFTYEPSNYDNLSDLIVLSYLKLREYKEAQKEIDEWREKYPDSYLMYTDQIHLYNNTRKLKDAEALLQKLDVMNMEINEENSCIFIAAREFYIIKKNRKKAAWLEEQIDQQMEKIMMSSDDDFDEDDDDDLDYDDDDDDYDEDDFDDEDIMGHPLMEMMRSLIISDADERFDQNIRKYRKEKTEEAEQEILKAFARMFFINREFWLQRNRNGSPKTVRSDGKTWIALYTEPEKARKDGVRDPDIVTAGEMLQYSDEHPRTAGYLIDPEPGYDGYVLPYITVTQELHELLSGMMNYLIKKHGSDPDDLIIDEEDLPF